MGYTGKGLHICLEDCHMTGGEKVFTKGNIYLFKGNQATNDAGRDYHGVSHGSWGEHFVNIENPEVSLKKPFKVMKGQTVDVFMEFLEKTDLPQLQKQKINLISLEGNAIKKKDRETLGGIVNFLDHFQDMLVDGYEVEGKYVFNQK